MRVLILSAFLACAATAPSAPLYYHSPAIFARIPTNIHTLTPGDLQAAAIDAQVQINDLNRAAVEKTQQLNEQAVQQWNAQGNLQAAQIRAQVAVAGIPSIVSTLSPGDIQAAAIDAQVQINDLNRAAAEKAREFNEQAVQQWNAQANLVQAIQAKAQVAVPGIPSIVPTLSPGDIQAAAIDAQVQINDLNRAAAEKAREFNEQAIQQWNTQANLEQAIQAKAQVAEAGIPSIAPTLSPGDIQAAAIDAQVQINDLNRAAAEKAREFNEQAAQQLNEQANLAQAAQAQTPVAVAGVPSAASTLSPGDIQAAAINAQVQKDDISRAAADQARELIEQAAEARNEKLRTNINWGQEQAGDAFWNAEEKKWQYLDALKTTEAQIDGAVANQADILAKSTLKRVVAPYFTSIGPVVPSPIIYSSVITPSFSSVSTQSLVETHSESAKTESVQAAGKTAEVKSVEGKAQHAEVKSDNSLNSDTKAVAVDAAKNEPGFVAVARIGTPIAASLLKYNGVAVSPAVFQPFFKHAAPIQYVSNPCL